MTTIKTFSIISSFLLLTILSKCFVHCTITDDNQIVKLSYFNLKKVVLKFKAVIVKFDENYPADLTKDHSFKKLGNELRFSEDILVGHMVVPYQTEAIEDNLKESDFKHERKLANVLNITKQEDLPVIYLYTRNDFERPIRYQNDKFDSHLIRDFIRANCKEVIFNLESCVPQLDELAREFAKKTDLEKRKKIFKETQIKINLLNDEEKSSGEFYLKLMERIMERGDIFIESENERIKNLLNGKLSDSKKNDLQKRLNILDSFRTISPSNFNNDKTEL